MTVRKTSRRRDASFDVGALHAAAQTGSSGRRARSSALRRRRGLVPRPRSTPSTPKSTRSRTRSTTSGRPKCGCGSPSSATSFFAPAAWSSGDAGVAPTQSSTGASRSAITRCSRPDVERLFADTYDTLVRVTEELDIARDLLAGVRDHLQSKVAENQNEVGKKLTVIASLVLVPSFIVGFYGQNFEGVFDREYWTLGVSVGLIVVSTLIQLALFRWRRWI